MGCSPPGSSCLWGFSRQEYWTGLPCPRLGDLLNPGIEPRFPALQADSFLSETRGKAENTGVGCRALLQGIFLTRKILHWVWVSHIAGRFFTSGAPREAHTHTHTHTHVCTHRDDPGSDKLLTHREAFLHPQRLPCSHLRLESSPGFLWGSTVPGVQEKATPHP